MNYEKYIKIQLLVSTSLKNSNQIYIGIYSIVYVYMYKRARIHGYVPWTFIGIDVYIGT